MTEFLSTYYLWTKSLHIISVISWMAGLLYLPRLFMYHVTTQPDSEASQYFITMERRLVKIILRTALLLSFLFGTALLLTPGVVDWTAGWLHVKLSLVLLLTGFHGLLVRWQKQFAVNQRPHSEKFFRLINEVPAFLMIGIVLMVVLKPF